KLKHQYPHSWRSKKPIIFRNTPQWFIAMDKPVREGRAPSPLEAGRRRREAPDDGQRGGGGSVEGANLVEVGAASHPNPLPANGERGPIGYTLRETALAAIKETRWVPASGENRINGMVGAKPDWVMSRQRAWGVPIAVFVAKGGHEPLVDEEVNK